MGNTDQKTTGLSVKLVMVGNIDQKTLGLLVKSVMEGGTDLLDFQPIDALKVGGSDRESKAPVSAHYNKR